MRSGSEASRSRGRGARSGSDLVQEAVSVSGGFAASWARWAGGGSAGLGGEVPGSGRHPVRITLDLGPLARPIPSV